MYRNTPPIRFAQTLGYLPTAVAMLRGSNRYPTAQGMIRFYQTPQGVIVSAEVTGLPRSDDPCRQPIFALHLHDGTACTGNDTDPFAGAGGHYNPHGCPHPYHAGDLPPLFGSDGNAFSAFLTNRFTVEEIVGKAVIIHASPDDFTTQPAGNAGMRIACGTVSLVQRSQQ